MRGHSGGRRGPRNQTERPKGVYSGSPGRQAGQSMRCPQEEWVDMESCSFVSQWGQVRCPLCRLWRGSSSGVQSLCATPPKSILEVLKFTTRQGEENACWRKRQAWLLRLH